MFEKLRSGQVDRSKFTENGNFYFTPAALADYHSSLSALGELKSMVRYKPTGLRGGLTIDRYILTFTDRKLQCVVRADPSTNRIEQFALYPFTD